jgi:hypothetical protein
MHISRNVKFVIDNKNWRQILFLLVIYESTVTHTLDKIVYIAVKMVHD